MLLLISVGDNLLLYLRFNLIFLNIGNLYILIKNLFEVGKILLFRLDEIYLVYLKYKNFDKLYIMLVVYVYVLNWFNCIYI